MERCVAVLSCLPKAPEWTNKEVNGQYLGRGGLDGAGGQREKGSWTQRKLESKSWKAEWIVHT